MKFISSLLILLFINLGAYSQQLNSCEKAQLLLDAADQYHYQIPDYDTKFSRIVFTEFIDLLDPYEVYFSKGDIQHLKTWQDSIAGFIRKENTSFITQTSKLYQQKLSQVDSLLKKLQNTKFNFEEEDSLSWIGSFNGSLAQHWERIIKLKVLGAYSASLDSANYAQTVPNQKLNELKNKIIAHEQCRIQPKLTHANGTFGFVELCFLKAVARAFDPHTDYFTPAEENAFMQSLSKETQSFGLQVINNELGEIEISQIIPGSSAWNSNQLNEGDIIVSIKAAGFKEDLNCVNVNAAFEFLALDQIQEAEFKVRKKNGKLSSLNLQKTIIDVDENIIQSYILEGSNAIGYIYLPSFYSQSDDFSLSKGCANDVAKEIVKLKRKGINGLILDLRNNGGGSMMEAILMSGIFVDYGTISIFHKKGNDPLSLKDMNRGTIFNAPLVILINKYSASASELFAAAMQDLNRAIIVGSDSYGKSTAQEIIAIEYPQLQNQKRKAKPAPPMGFMKLSMGAFYRVNGKTHQRHGVQPDLRIPSVHDSLISGEAKYATALKLQPINKKTYYFPLDSFPLQQLRKKQAQRFQNDSLIAQIRAENKKQIQHEKQNPIIPLNYSQFMHTFIDLDNTAIEAAKQNFEVSNTNQLQSFSNDTEELTEKQVKNDIQSDYFIGEAFNIILDFIEINKK